MNEKPVRKPRNVKINPDTPHVSGTLGVIGLSGKAH